MTRWPPIVWLCISLASLLVIVGVGGDYNPQTLIPGIALGLVGFGLALYLAFGRWRQRPRATGVSWLLPALVVFYVICAVAALIAGSEYALAALGAAVIPLTAAALLVATTRAKTRGSDERRREVTADAEADPFPGIGMNDATPLGDTSEHSDAERVAEPDRLPARRPHRPLGGLTVRAALETRSRRRRTGWEASTCWFRARRAGVRRVRRAFGGRL